MSGGLIARGRPGAACQVRPSIGSQPRRKNLLRAASVFEDFADSTNLFCGGISCITLTHDGVEIRDLPTARMVWWSSASFGHTRWETAPALGVTVQIAMLRCPVACRVPVKDRC